MNDLKEKLRNIRREMFTMKMLFSELCDSIEETIEEVEKEGKRDAGNSMETDKTA